jgi:hypothetical protein
VAPRRCHDGGALVGVDGNPPRVGRQLDTGDFGQRFWVEQEQHPRIANGDEETIREREDLRRRAWQRGRGDGAVRRERQRDAP